MSEGSASPRSNRNGGLDELREENLAKTTLTVNKGVEIFLSDVLKLHYKQDQSNSYEKNSFIFWGVTIECRVMEGASY
jgi:hypothetical protein